MTNLFKCDKIVYNSEKAMTHYLKQIPTTNGINKHRAWIDKVSGVIVHSNDDVIGDKFYIGNGEGVDTKWFGSPTEAILSLRNI